MEGNHNSQIISNLACPPPFLSNQKLHSITAMKTSSDSNFDMFTMMKENALFLLELSSTNSRKLKILMVWLIGCISKILLISMFLQRFWEINENFHIKCPL